MLIRIKSCENPKYYYKNLVGKIVEVENDPWGRGYRHLTESGDYSTISFSDAQVLNEATVSDEVLIDFSNWMRKNSKELFLIKNEEVVRRYKNQLMRGV